MAKDRQILDREEEELESSRFATLMAEADFDEFQRELAEAKRMHFRMFLVAFVGALAYSTIIMLQSVRPSRLVDEFWFFAWGFRWLSFVIWAAFVPRVLRRRDGEESALPLFARAELSGEVWQLTALILPQLIALGIGFAFD